MSGKAIGTNLPFGFRGNVARTPDCVIAPYVAVGSNNIPFGAPLVYDATNHGVRPVAAGDNASDIVGIAVRRLGQPYENSPTGYYYKPGETVDVLVIGTINVELESITGLAMRGTVYVNPTTGEFTAAASHTENDSTVNHLAMPNTKFSKGQYDSNKITSVTILARNI